MLLGIEHHARNGISVRCLGLARNHHLQAVELLEGICFLLQNLHAQRRCSWGRAIGRSLDFARNLHFQFVLADFSSVHIHRGCLHVEISWHTTGYLGRQLDIGTIRHVQILDIVVPSVQIIGIFDAGILGKGDRRIDAVRWSHLVVMIAQLKGTRLLIVGSGVRLEGNLIRHGLHKIRKIWNLHFLHIAASFRCRSISADYHLGSAIRLDGKLRHLNAGDFPAILQTLERTTRKALDTEVAVECEIDLRIIEIHHHVAILQEVWNARDVDIAQRIQVDGWVKLTRSTVNLDIAHREIVLHGNG